MISKKVLSIKYTFNEWIMWQRRTEQSKGGSKQNSINVKMAEECWNLQYQ